MDVTLTENKCSSKIDLEYLQNSISIRMPFFLRSHIHNCPSCQNTLLEIDFEKPIPDKAFGKPFSKVKAKWFPVPNSVDRKYSGDSEFHNDAMNQKNFRERMRFFMKTHEKRIQLIYHSMMALSVVQGVYLIIRFVIRANE